MKSAITTFLPLQIAIKALNLSVDTMNIPSYNVDRTSGIVWKACNPVFVDIHLEYLTIYEINTEVCITSKIIEPSMIKRGYYMKQIENYLKYFRREQFYLIDFKNFNTNIISVLNVITNFLNSSSFHDLNLNLEFRNERINSDTLDTKLYHLLLVHFYNKNRGLEEQGNLRLDWMHT